MVLGLKQEIFKTSEKIKKMSLEEIVYKSFKHGTIFILDGMAINAGTLATSSAGRKFVSQMADVLTSPMAEEFALEVAGIGKITLEEGADIANMAIEVVEKNPKLIQTEGSFVGAVREIVDVEKLANKIRKVGDDILDLSEKAGGHGLEKHIGKTNDELILRGYAK